MKNAEGITVKIKDDINYKISLNRAVPWEGRMLSPMAEHTVIGAMLNKLPEDAISDVQPV